MVAGKHNDRHAIGAGAIGALQACELDGQSFKPAKRAGRLGELVLPGLRRVAMRRRDGGTLPIDPRGEN
jgi:hypothetical protein